MMKTVRNENGEKVGSVVHVFDHLGKGPFQFIGVNKNLHVPYPGAPAEACRPGGTCAHCSNGILYEFIIQDANGKRFVVGSDCVNKTDDAGLRRVIDREVAEIKRKANIERQDRRIARAMELLPSVSEKLAAELLPNRPGESMLNTIQWYMSNAGRKGKCWAASIIEKAARGEPL